MHDVDAECVVLSSLSFGQMHVEDFGELVADDFFGSTNRTIASAIWGLSAEGRPTCITSILGWLKDHGHSGEVGATDLVRVIQATPSLANVPAFADRVRRLAHQRAFSARLTALAAKSRQPGAQLSELVRETADVADFGGERSAELAPGRWLADIGRLDERPPERDWFLWDLRTNEGLLERGKCTVLTADGGVGKSFMVLELAVAVALGTPWVGTFAPPVAGGYVALLMAEDDEAECLSRLWRIANALNLDGEQRALLGTRLLIVALAGRDVSLVGLDQDRRPHRTGFAATIQRQLASVARRGGFEWSLVGCDPLARFGAASEADNASATALVEVFERLALELPGRPHVLVSHHSSKTAIRGGGVDVRGVTGIRNGFRAVLTMTKVDADDVDGVLLTNTKNNSAPCASQLSLARTRNEYQPDGTCLEVGGVLRPATEEEARALAVQARTDSDAAREARQHAKRLKSLERDQSEQDAILRVLPEHPEHITQSELRSGLRSAGKCPGSERLRNLLQSMRDDGLVVDASNGRKSSSRAWSRPRSPH